MFIIYNLIIKAVFDWELDRFVEYRLPIKKPL